MVVVQHALGGLGPPALRALLAPLEIGSVAVLLFFVLSGFIVVEAAALFYERRASAFLINRMIRIYPPYLVAVLLTVVTTFAIEHLHGENAVVALLGAWPDLSAQNILAGLFGIFPVLAKLLEPKGSEPILVLAWALRIEMIFYAVVFLALFVGRVINQPAARLLGLFGISSLLYDAVNISTLRGSGFEFTPYFVAGAALYFAITPASVRRRVIATGLAVVSVAMIASHIGAQSLVNEKGGYVRDLAGQRVIFFAGLAVWLGLMALPALAQRTYLRARAADQALGDLTYPIYLTHMAALLPCLWLLGSRPAIAWPAALGAVIGLAWLMHRIVEKPLVKMRQKNRGQDLLMPAAGIMQT